LLNKEYIDDKPVKAGLAARAQYYPLLLCLFVQKSKRPTVLYAAPLCCGKGLRQQGIVLLRRLDGMSKLMP